MIEIFKFSNNMLQQLDKPESDCWINVVKPTEEELSGLRTLIEIPEEVILSLQDKEEMPTVEIRKKHVFIILRTPNKNSDLNYITVPLGIILTEDYVITLCFHNNDMIEKLKHNFKAHNKKELALNLMLMCSRIYLNYLGEINNMIDNLETQLYKSQKNKEIAKLLGLEQSLVYFSTSLESNEILVKKIASLKFF